MELKVLIVPGAHRREVVDVAKQAAGRRAQATNDLPVSHGARDAPEHAERPRHGETVGGRQTRRHGQVDERGQTHSSISSGVNVA